MSLVLYSSSESEEEKDNGSTRKKFKRDIVLPSVKIQLVNEIDIFEKDHVDQANDRQRLFAHERGNWSVSVFSWINCSPYLDTLIDDLIELFNIDERQTWKRLDELHVSLSKTFPIRFHHIESIRNSLKQELNNSLTKFSTKIDSVQILSNEDKSTSFLVFTLDQQKSFQNLTAVIDRVLHEHRYPIYYENPCFHISFAYSTDPKRHETLRDDWQNKSQAILAQYRCQPSALNFLIDDIRFKAGKRVYQLLN